MKMRTIIIGLLVTLFFVSNVYAIEKYRWGMTKAEAIAVLQQVMASQGMSVKEKDSVNGMVILDTLQDNHPIGSSVFHFDENGGLVGVGSLIYVNTEKEAIYIYKHTNGTIQSKTNMKLKATSDRKAIYQSPTEQVVVFVTQDQRDVFAVGIATSKLKE